MAADVQMTWADGLIPLIDPGMASQIISRVADIVMVVSATGVIKQVMGSPNFNGLARLAHLKGRAFTSTVTIESVPKFETRVAQFLSGTAQVLPIELNHKATGDLPELPIRYSLHPVDQGDDVVLLGRDLRATAEMQQQLVVAQIALENEYEAQREHDIRLRVMMEASDVSSVFVSVASGKIEACNTATEVLLGKTREELVGSVFVDQFEAKGRRSVIDRMVASATEQEKPPVVAKISRGNTRLTLDPTLFRGANSQMLLCKIQLADGQVRPVDQLQGHLSDLYKNSVDAIVFVGTTGNILSANEAFLKLANVTHAQSVKNRPMLEYLARGSVDLNVMLENARRNGSMRLYATKIINEHGDERAVEVATTQLKAGDDPIFALIIRDSRRVDTVSAPSTHITDVDMNSVIELIGGQSLKDIVARTTDVVEKMCIETAVEMTSNNRVAAAEMLGLSRQSLYVKLRKYGLVSKS